MAKTCWLLPFSMEIVFKELPWIKATTDFVLKLCMHVFLERDGCAEESCATVCSGPTKKGLHL
ncbi:hypothetical protein DPEC_G00061500 [Dallia pectoralis]|uniref:Uncharacterized protein n=1 Tax=Dallia pectoralis TaxID=75939 RepID=A0ACC2H7V2_DALPE|nr:hypothetical protein DPEC_G00061500 [Dallia pectoralis]